jgi:hypothetical protein
MFCAPELILSGTEGVGSYFHILRSRTRFRRYRGQRVQFSCFAVPKLVFDDRGGVGSRFHILRSMKHFRRYRGRQVQFSCFALPNSFSAVPCVSGPFFIFSAPGLIFGGIAGVESRFHGLRSKTRFHRYRGPRIPYSCFPLPNSFSAVEGASGTVFMFCAVGHVFGGTEGVGSCFHVLRSRTRFQR